MFIPLKIAVVTSSGRLSKRSELADLDLAADVQRFVEALDVSLLLIFIGILQVGMFWELLFWVIICFFAPLHNEEDVILP